MKKPTDSASGTDSPGAALARLRWSRVAPAERSRIASEIAQARWEQTTPEERRKMARRAARARWAKAKAAKRGAEENSNKRR